MVIKKPQGEVEIAIKDAIPGSGKVEQDDKLCLPLLSVNTTTTIHESLSHIELTQKFVNPTE